ncbi:hypothetical protein LVJ82_04595 [Vitreoscilla massiliensis]|uniref:DUF4376 domain-containing protein n=1 Tax=Vitreoscilla massiliensis TaxID=1689272 RepID=A0ABY4E5V6_9NEIS|nr:hypothetical protein [Vitreoscilla massiliensis]UOO90270.1 hypothetical protein LVJ82_04595 [Vitreoscilla massiliensis]
MATFTTATTIIENGIVFFEDENGNDFYACQAEFSADTMKMVLDQKCIVAYSTDVSTFAPQIGQSVIELPADVCQDIATGQYVFNGVLAGFQPDAYHIWNAATKTWETDADLQAAKLADWRNNVAEITPKQLRMVLLENGVNSKAVETAIAAIEDETIREVAMIEWQYATGYQRNNANLIMIATELLGFDDLKIDAMWQSALLK